ncbi:hypothetical protein [Amycolatopsis sp. NPDC021455]|uniref:hypothetical protein n=1 Tax=Amycolatopsis sp. NPDC021455 TaxID=3154901 RepID=UPI0033F6B56F
MKNAIVAAGAAAAFLVLAPGAALAATPTTAPSPVPATKATLPVDPEGPFSRITRLVTLSPVKAMPGAHVKLDFACQTREADEKIYVHSPALAFHKAGNWADGTVKTVKPGKYAVTLHCGPETSTATLEVLPLKEQVAKVPAGAPQTGGTDGPVDGSGTPLAAAAAMGVLAVGGSGLVLARRARRR